MLYGALYSPSAKQVQFSQNIWPQLVKWNCFFCPFSLPGWTKHELQWIQSIFIRGQTIKRGNTTEPSKKRKIYKIDGWRFETKSTKNGEYFSLAVFRAPTKGMVDWWQTSRNCLLAPSIYSVGNILAVWFFFPNYISF